MKLLTLSLAALASAALLTGCASDDPQQQALNDDGAVTFTVNLPADLGTRASYESGTKAVNLTYGIYDTAGTLVATNYGSTDPNDAVTFSGLKASFSVSLIRGKQYQVVFWAQDNAQTGLYTFTPTDATIKVDYTKMTETSENYDAFYAMKPVVGGTPSETVSLTRPLAQINVGTDDLSSAIVAKEIGTNVYTTLSVDNVCNTMNLLSGAKSYTDASGAVATAPTVTLTQKAVNPANQTFPVTATDPQKPYQYLAMGYVLTDEALTNLTADFYAANATTPVTSLDVPNCPIKSNFRTNIYGSLLTAPTEFNLEILPAFQTPDTDIEVPYGEISNAAQLAAAIQNGGTYKVTANVGAIDLTACNSAQPLQLVLLSSVGDITIGYPTSYTGSYPEVSVFVAKDVPFPNIVKNTAVSEVMIKNFHLVGVRGTTAKCSGINFNPITDQTDRPKKWTSYENVSFSSIEFDGGGLMLANRMVKSANNVSITGCNFVNLPITGNKGYETDGITLLVNTMATNPASDNLVITGNTMSWVAGTPAVDGNGIDVRDFNGAVTISDNVINSPSYIGIFYVGSGNATIQNNKITAGTDAVKIQGKTASPNSGSVIGNLLISDNTLTAGENGIRITRSSFANTPAITIFGNKIAYNTKNLTYDATAGEPAGILIYNSYGDATQSALLNVYNNVKSGTGSEWFVMKGFELANGSNVSAPF